MQFIANRANNYYLKNLIVKMNNVDILNEISSVKCAVAYATNMYDLFNFCHKNNLPLNFYCRNDYSIPVSPTLLQWFIGKHHNNIICKLVGEFFHAKVIWIAGYGVYIGSANLTERAWANNIEAGLFLTESEIDNYQQREQLELFFDYLDDNKNHTLLTQEIINELKDRQERYKKIRMMIDDFERGEKDKNTIPVGNNPIGDKQSAQEKRKDDFIKEWNSTLEILREIADFVSTSYRPIWVKDSIPKTTQADQFLHAYYYKHVMDGNASMHMKWYEVNKNDRNAALTAAMNWWKNTSSPPSKEDKQFYDWGPAILNIANKSRTTQLDEAEFVELCCKIHAFRNHSRQIKYSTLGIPFGESVADGEEKIRKGAEWVYRQRSAHGKTVLDLINYLLYSGNEQGIVLRLWEAHRSEKWKIPHFGLSCLGELIGWALPEWFPPRNNRTNKALRALGYKEVELFSGD